MGPAETEPHVLADLGMSNADATRMAHAWRANMDKVNDRIVADGAMSKFRADVLLASGVRFFQG